MSSSNIPPPTNSLVTPLLTDLYQITMTYAHWKNSRQDDPAIFELFFRKNPFGGEFTIFCGLDEVLKFVCNFKFSASDVAYLQSTPSLSKCEPGFLGLPARAGLQSSGIAIHEGGNTLFSSCSTHCGERTSWNYAIVGNDTFDSGQLPVPRGDQRSTHGGGIARSKCTCGTSHPTESFPQQCKREPKCVEFGLRRAQGPDGGFSASKYCNVSGFVGTSNVQAGKLLGLAIAGTHAHSFVQAYYSLEEVEELTVADATNGDEQVLLVPRVLEYREKIG